jgi:hypothetical protein
MQPGLLFFLFQIFRCAAHQVAGGVPALSAPVAIVALTSLWQGIAVACAVAICLQFVPRISAAHRFVAWLAAFLAIICLPFLQLFTHLVTAHISSAAAQTAPIEPALIHPALRNLDPRWALAIAVLWLAASLYRAANLAIHALRMRRLWQTAIPIAQAPSVPATETPCPIHSPSLWRMGGKARKQSGRGLLARRQRLQICTTEALQRPAVIGFPAPRILIPAWLLSKLTQPELDQIVLHESEHLRRLDDWTNLFQKLCLVLFPLNPALWWIERRLCLEREMACDDAVVRRTQSPRAYAACLAGLAERGLQRQQSLRGAEALSLGAWQRRPELVRRVHRILLSQRALSPAASRAALCLLAGALVLGSVKLSECPQLVAFAPTHQPSPSTQIYASTRPQLQGARLINTAFIVKDNSGIQATNRSISATGMGSATGTDLSARQARISDHGKTQPVGDLYQGTASAVPINPSKSVRALAPEERLLNAESKAPQPEVNDQQWIVLTAWEQIQTPAQNPTSADFDESTAATQSGKSTAQATTQITVTRLIFRVVPASPSSTKPSSTSQQPAPATIPGSWPGSWFVIQL